MARVTTGRLNDLLGVSFTEIYRDSQIRYVLNHPGVVSTSFAGDYDEATAAQIEALKISGKTVQQSVAQVLPYLDAPPAQRLTAVLEGQRIPVDTGLFDSREAERLHEVTKKLLAGRLGVSSSRFAHTAHGTEGPADAT